MSGADLARERGWWRFLPSLLVTLAYLVPALASLDDYGPTYDAIKGDYPYGERLLGYLETGDEAFLDLKAREPVPFVRAPHPDFDVGRYPSHWIFPVGSLLSALSCRWLWSEWGWLPAMSAHHLPFVLLAAALVFVLSAFARARFGVLAGIVAGGVLGALPNFFGHSFNNPKDLPECVFYTGAVLAGFVALESGRTRTWLLAGALTGLALAQKPNALFLPFQLLLFVAGARLLVRGAPPLRITMRHLLATTFAFLVAYYAVSPPFWAEPIEGPRRWITQMLTGGSHAFRDASEGEAAAISFAAPLAVLHCTPPVVLGLALLGLLRPGIPATMRLFLLISLALPIGRNLLPGMRNFDGTRHFLEFLPFLALLAGAGAAWLARLVSTAIDSARRHFGRGDERGARDAVVQNQFVQAFVGLCALLPPIWATLSTHPNQIAYFNVFAGGLGGQQARGHRDAADYWGNSYWQGLDWLSAHAEPGARVLVPYKEFMARASVPVRLRADLRLERALKTTSELLPVYVMQLVNRGKSPFRDELERTHAPLHEVRVQNGAVLRLYRIEADEPGRALMATWERERDTRTIKREVMAYLGDHPELEGIVLEVYRAKLEPEEALERLRAHLPAALLERLTLGLGSEGE